MLGLEERKEKELWLVSKMSKKFKIKNKIGKNEDYFES